MKGAYIFLADGFEDIEALGTRDVLIRGGLDVKLVSISDEPFVTSSHGVTVGADELLTDVDSEGKAAAEDVMIFPGGMPGSTNLGNCKELIDLMNEHYSQGGTVAAICAAPAYVLSQLEGIRGATCTCFEGCEGRLLAKGVTYVRKPAVTCGRIITGRSSGYSIDFGLEILRSVKGEDEIKKVIKGMFPSCE